MIMPLRRKKWTEEEEEALICKYGELLSSGFLSKTKSRERKFEPIAAHVNALFHARNPVAYPWLWTWKDASTKVQNMRHQFLGVKAKIRKLAGELEAFDWADGLSQWSNFLKYKEVFGDQELDVNDFFTPSHPSSLAPPCTHLISALSQQDPRHQPHSVRCGPLPGSTGMHCLSKDLINDDGMSMEDHNRVLLLPSVKDGAASMVDQAVLDSQNGDLTNGLDFGYDGTAGDSLKDADVDYEDDEGSALAYTRLKRTRHCGKLDLSFDINAHDSKILALFASHFTELNERAARREEKLMEREREWEKRQASIETELGRQRQEWEKERREMLEMWHKEADRREVERQEWEQKHVVAERERREMERERDRARDEKLEREKMEWREKMEMQSIKHQAAMMQIQLQIAQNQQNALALLSGALVHIAGNGNDFSLESSSISPFVSQLLQNLQTHGNAIGPCNIRRNANESSDSQFDTD
ncbi:hypothetical protein GOP47_0003411 [Adiantum capillus-veneris]|uniref:Uncharacterized protein n=1 Tax=Adiantum capillus-veneris TaxID=13818 RepID=A0A9D4VCE3_ADICA|nr:hypothetical protein GOP47_0003411 [Adiantum capillus-veneris]